MGWTQPATPSAAHLQVEVDRLRAENEDLRQAIAAAPGAPKPGGVCGTCGQRQERGAGFDGRPTHGGDR